MRRPLVILMCLPVWLAACGGGGSAAPSPLSVPAPTGLAYPTPIQSTYAVAIAPLVPTVIGTVTRYAVTPFLPSGLTLNETTGVLTGIPLEAPVPATRYTITASNAGGMTSFVLTLTVIAPPPGTVLTGVFRDSTVSGLGYRSGSQTGVTDATGAYSYEVGQSITFFVGDVILGTVAVPKALISPIDLVPGGTGSTAAAINLARFLMMLDRDGDPLNGIQISAAVTAAAANWPAVDFTTTDLPSELAGIIAQVDSIDGVTHSLPDAAAAQAHLQAALACAYSGGFVGVYAGDSIGGAGQGALYLQIWPDGTVDAVGQDFEDGQAFEYTSNPGNFNPLLGNSFDLEPPFGGTFADPDLLTGTNAPLWAARIGGDSAAEYRFTGSLFNDEAGDIYLGLVVLDLDSANQLTGYLVSVAQRIAIRITGSVSGTTFEATGGGTTYSGRLDPGALTLHGETSANNIFFTRGCRLN
jgi:Putative Ig domain